MKTVKNILVVLPHWIVTTFNCPGGAKILRCTLASPHPDRELLAKPLQYRLAAHQRGDLLQRSHLQQSPAHHNKFKCIFVVDTLVLC